MEMYKTCLHYLTYLVLGLLGISCIANRDVVDTIEWFKFSHCKG